MDKILTELLNELDLLKLYIDFQNSSYKSQARLEKINTDSILNTLPISKIKQFDFNSHIISIYGAFENFVEQVLAEYLKLICSKVTEFNNLPSEIQKNNLTKCLEILKQLDYPKHKNIKKEVIIEILHKNFNENSASLNIDAFKNHSANFRISTINSYFSEVGIKSCSSLIRHYSPLNNYLENNITDYSSKKDNIVFQILEHICDLRNNIAHGVKNIQLINKSILFEYIDFIKIFSQALFEIVTDNYYSLIFDKITHEIKPLNIFDRKILCFNTNGKVINRTSKILAHSPDTYPRFFEVSILEIQYEKKSVEETDNNIPVDIGVLVDKRIKDTMCFKLIE